MAEKLGAGRRALDLARPFVAFAAFLAADRWVGWMWSVPLAIATVLAASVLVHDLIHGNVALPKAANRYAGEWRRLV